MNFKIALKSLAILILLVIYLSLGLYALANYDTKLGWVAGGIVIFIPVFAGIYTLVWNHKK